MRRRAMGTVLLLVACTAFDEAATTDASSDEGGATAVTISGDGTTQGGSAADSTDGGAADTSDGGDADPDGGPGPAATDDAPAARCGNGVPEGDEPCDDANASEIDGCTSTCELGPTGLAFGRIEPTDVGGGTSDADPADDDCPDGQVLVGFSGDLTSDGVQPAVVLGRIRGVCAELSLVDADPTAVVTSPGAELPLHGEFEGGGPYAVTCPRGAAMIAAHGRSGTVMDAMRIECASLLVDGRGPAQTIVLGEARGDGPVGGISGNSWGPVACPAGEIAVGAHLETSAYVVRLGLRCAPLTLAY